MKLEKGNCVFKQKKNDIDIVFNNKVQLSDNKILTQAAPEWFKHMPHNSQPGINQRFLNGKTAKTCPGVWDYFNNTYMLRCHYSLPFSSSPLVDHSECAVVSHHFNRNSSISKMIMVQGVCATPNGIL